MTALAIIVPVALAVTGAPTPALAQENETGHQTTVDPNKLATEPSTWKGALSWVDHVITPVGVLGFMVAEDAIDRLLIVRIESWTRNKVIRGLARTALNPSRTLSNGVQGREPWWRPVRPLGG